MNVFKTLNRINVNEQCESKGGLTYLSWAWAWAELKKAYPEANYFVYENKDGWNYHHDGKTAWVKTGVTIEGLEHIEYLPVLDFKNKAIPMDKITSFNVNTAIQRSVTKCIARHGLGLYIYAGEDLPDIPIWDSGERDEYVHAIKESVGESEFDGIKQLWQELTSRQKNDIWKAFDGQEQVIIKEALRPLDENKEGM
jgi:hypothetical protein